jgi:hypothetical protein
MTASKVQPTDKSQREKFEQAARELETDDREEVFDAALKKVAKAPQPTTPKPGKRLNPQG